MTKFESILLLCAATVCLSGCALRSSGPCYGPGCPTFMMGSQARDSDGTSVNSVPRTSGHSENAQTREQVSAKRQTDPGQ
jgi:hypothetical protein